MNRESNSESNRELCSSDNCTISYNAILIFWFFPFSETAVVACIKCMMILAGKMKGIAFIKDPDGYWIEIFDLKTIGSTTSVAA